VVRPQVRSSAWVLWGAMGLVIGGILGVVGSALDWVTLEPRALPQRFERFEGRSFSVQGLDVIDEKVLLAISAIAAIAGLAAWLVPARRCVRRRRGSAFWPDWWSGS
jgi:hypothetical protein